MQKLLSHFARSEKRKSRTNSPDRRACEGERSLGTDSGRVLRSADSFDCGGRGRGPKFRGTRALSCGNSQWGTSEGTSSSPLRGGPRAPVPPVSTRTARRAHTGKELCKKYPRSQIETCFLQNARREGRCEAR